MLGLPIFHHQSASGDNQWRATLKSLMSASSPRPSSSILQMEARVPRAKVPGTWAARLVPFTWVYRLVRVPSGAGNFLKPRYEYRHNPADDFSRQRPVDNRNASGCAVDFCARRGVRSAAYPLWIWQRLTTKSLRKKTRQTLHVYWVVAAKIGKVDGCGDKLSPPQSADGSFETRPTGNSALEYRPEWINLSHMILKAIVHPAEEGGFWAEVPALPGCLTQGETLDELQVNLREAIELWLSVDDQVTATNATDTVLELTV